MSNRNPTIFESGRSEQPPIIFDSGSDRTGDRPELSVILPVRNGEPFLRAQLEALAGQTFRGSWELIVADNRSTDRSVHVARSFADRLPRLIIVEASHRPGRAAACNAGAAVAGGAALAFCDADDVAHPQWLERCAEACRHHPFIAGAVDHFTLGPPAAPWKARMLAQPPMMPGGRPFALGANLIVARAAFDFVGGFSEDLQRAEDVDLSWRLERAGFRLHFEPTAVIFKRGRSGYREIWRQAVAWGAGDVELARRHGSRAASASPRAALELLRDPRLREKEVLKALLDPRQRRSWVAAVARVWGRVRASLAARDG